MLITHGHFDHVHDALEIAKTHKPKIVTNFETGAWLRSKGVDAATITGANTGGTVEVDGIKVTLVHAEYPCGISEGDQIPYGGEPSGLVVEFENGFTVYFLRRHRRLRRHGADRRAEPVRRRFPSHRRPVHNEPETGCQSGLASGRQDRGADALRHLPAADRPPITASIDYRMVVEWQGGVFGAWSDDRAGIEQ